MNKLFVILLFINLTVTHGNDQLTHKDYRKRAHQLNQRLDEYDIIAEVEFGRGLAAKILGRYPLVANKTLQKYVHTLGTALSAQIGRPELTYHFAVIESEQVNAYAAPGGYIFITSAAMKWIKNEDQLIGVLAHEIGHVNARSVIKRLNVRGKDGSLASGIGVLIGGATGAYREAVSAAMDKAYMLLFEEGLSHKEELKCDQYAVTALYANQLNWQSYIDLISSLDQVISAENKKVVNKTHPSVDSRVNFMKNYSKYFETSLPEVRKKRFHNYVQL